MLMRATKIAYKTHFFTTFGRRLSVQMMENVDFSFSLFAPPSNSGKNVKIQKHRFR